MNDPMTQMYQAAMALIDGEFPMTGREIAMSVDPNTSNDVCTFCKHATFDDGAPVCALGFTSYFRSLSNMGPIWVSDCKAGELRPELAAMERQP